MKPIILLFITLTSLLAHKTDAWPWQRWFEDDNSVSAAIPTLEDDITEMDTGSLHLIDTQYDPHTEGTNKTVESLMMTTEEAPSFWSNLYQILQDTFSNVMSSPNNATALVTTNEPLKTTDLKMTTLEIDDQGFFESFFASLANNLVTIYNGLSSGWRNSTMDAISDIPSYQDYLTKEVEALLQNYSLPISDEQDLDDMKMTIVNALVSAWNSSLEIGKIPVVSPDEIQAKILETLKGAQMLVTPLRNDTATVATHQDTKTTSGYPAMDPDEIHNKFLQILKEADVLPIGHTGDSYNPSSRSRGSFHKTGIEKKKTSSWNWF